MATPLTDSEKKCRRCEEQTPLGDFFKHTRAADGLDSICKACSKAKTYAWRAANPGAHARIQKRYYRDNAPKVLASNKAWHQKHPEYERERSKCRAKQNPKLHALRAQAARFKLSRAELIDLLKKPCAYCGDAASTLDHVVPVSRGGTNAMGNLVQACVSCNSSKGARTPEEWRAAGGGAAWRPL